MCNFLCFKRICHSFTHAVGKGGWTVCQNFIAVGVFLVLHILIGTGVVVTPVLFILAIMEVNKVQNKVETPRWMRWGCGIVVLLSFNLYVYFSFDSCVLVRLAGLFCATTIVVVGIGGMSFISNFIEIWRQNRHLAVLQVIVELVAIFLIVEIHFLVPVLWWGKCPYISCLVGLGALESCQRLHQHKEIYTTFIWPLIRASIIFLCILQCGLGTMGIHLFTQ